jgi:glycerol-3-phosphate dehydrogenase (NAD(P)+)
MAVLGGGSWGSALAHMLRRAGHSVCVWARRDAIAEQLRAGRNDFYLPAVRLAEGIEAETDLARAVRDADIVLMAVPSSAVAATAQLLPPGDAPVVCAAKGLERESGRRLSEVLRAQLGATRPIALLLGPSHAEEVARDIPTAVVLAAADRALLSRLQPRLSSPRFRVYSNDDVAGVEYAAALKNVLAIAAGISDGIGLGDNTKGALLTRGVAEMARLGVSLGARRETFYGLSGIGDVITTCLSRHSRNRNFGERIGRGEDRTSAMAAVAQVVEGVETTRTAGFLARRHRIPMPIAFEVEQVLFHDKGPREAIEDLMLRALKSEQEEDWSLGPRRWTS